jgi:hypothetical protein
MLIYQVKIIVSASIEEEWLQWMKTVHVPDMIATGLIRSFTILKPAEMEQVYLFHYYFDSDSDYEHYQKQYAPKLKEHPTKKYPNQFKAERSVLHNI